MIELRRIVRFCIAFAPDVGAPPPVHNSFAAWPPMAGLGAFYELEVACCGPVDAVTGYLVNITNIDQAVRTHAAPLLGRIVRDSPARDPVSIMPELLTAVRSGLQPSVTSLRWGLTPYYSIILKASMMDRVTLVQHFDFAAAHRLHCPDLADEENRRIFGKCNNRNGHGHNYRLEVAASTPIHGTPTPFRLPDLERIVAETVIEKLDHTHLNHDVPEFSQLNPSLEHITQLCFRLLEPSIAAGGGKLDRVTVWETEKTSCTCTADGQRS